MCGQFGQVDWPLAAGSGRRAPTVGAVAEGGCGQQPLSGVGSHGCGQRSAGPLAYGLAPMHFDGIPLGCEWEEVHCSVSGHADCAGLDHTLVIADGRMGQ